MFLLVIISTVYANRLLLQTPQPIDPRSCTTANDCMVKNVGNCCGYYPGCVNINYEPDPTAVQAKCAEEGLSSICGWTDPSGCLCNENDQCIELYDSINLSTDTPTTTLDNNTTPNCGGFDYCISYDPDGCNTCSCCNDETNIECSFDEIMCTLVYCTPKQPKKCIECMNGYDIIDGQCISSICKLESNTGNCSQSLLRYFYNIETKMCEEFIWSGCDGNENNFQTEESCIKFGETCQIIPLITICGGFENCVSYNDGCNTCNCNAFGSIDCTDMYCDPYNEPVCEMCVVGYSLKNGKCVDMNELSECELESDSGPCEADMKRYFYNSNTAQCEMFSYGGCAGNANNFQTKQECINECVNAVPSYCYESKDIGPCKAAFEKYYYDSEIGECMTFIYGGCKGNGNNFDTISECISECVPLDKNDGFVMWYKLWIAIVLFVVAYYCL
eukprot:332514_1